MEQLNEGMRNIRIVQRKVKLNLSIQQHGSLYKMIMAYVLKSDISTLEKKSRLFQLWNIAEKRIRPRLLLTKKKNTLTLNITEAEALFCAFTDRNLIPEEFIYEHTLIVHITAEIHCQTV
jgi:hypothetical protein